VDNHIKTGPEPEEKSQDTPSRLTELENEIREGLATYQSVGKALDEIKADKLYKKLGFKNFKTYLLERWGISRAHAYRLMAAAKVAEMSPVGDKPKSERQANNRSEKRSKVVSNLDAEIESFKANVERWEKALSFPDYRNLIARVVELLNSSARPSQRRRWRDVKRRHF
jgi:hypothetical protein